VKELVMVQQIPSTYLRAAQGVGSLPHHPGSISRPEIDAAAKVLGMKPSDLLRALTSGKSIADLAKARGISLDDVKTAMLQPAKDRLAADLKSGRISQATYNQSLAKVQTAIADFVQVSAGPAPDALTGLTQGGAGGAPTDPLLAATDPNSNFSFFA
jgi:hypothetical protein